MVANVRVFCVDAPDVPPLLQAAVKGKRTRAVMTKLVAPWRLRAIVSSQRHEARPGTGSERCGVMLDV